MSDFWEQTLRLLSFSDANVRFVFAGMTALGVAGGVLGSFTLLRKRALIGDALAHAALPGIGAAFLLTGVKSTWVLLAGAYGAGVVGVLALLAIRRWSRVKDDAALAIVLTVFFGVGVVLLTYIQKTGMGGQSGLDKFLFGQSASLIGREVLMIAVVTALLLALALLLFKELKLLCFNPEYAGSLGFNPLLLDVILMGMTVGAVVIALQAVGVVLTAALLIIPPVTARLWSRSFAGMLVGSAVVGGLSGAVGSWLSFLAPRLPSGPLTVLAGAGLFTISLLTAPRRGLITRLLHRARTARRTTLENALRGAAELAETTGKPLDAPFAATELAQVRRWSGSEVRHYTGLLMRRGLAQRSPGGRVALTAAGVSEATAVLRRHRLWELFLIHQADIAADHVHRDAEESEHFLTPELEAHLLQLSGAAAAVPSSPHPLEAGGGDV